MLSLLAWKSAFEQVTENAERGLYQQECKLPLYSFITPLPVLCLGV